MRDAARTRSVESVWRDPSAFVRSALFSLEGGRHVFADNGMVLVSAEVERAEVLDPEVASMLRESELGRVSSSLEAERHQTELSREREAQAVERAKAEAKAETERFEANLEAERIARRLTLAEARVDADVKEIAKRSEEQAAKDALDDARQERALARKERSARLDEQITRGQAEVVGLRLESETRAAVARFEAAQGPLSEAVVTLGNQEVLAKVAQAVSAQHLLGGKDVADVVSKLFEGTSLQEVFEQVQERAASPASRNGVRKD